MTTIFIWLLVVAAFFLILPVMFFLGLLFTLIILISTVLITFFFGTENFIIFNTNEVTFFEAFLFLSLLLFSFIIFYFFFIFIFALLGFLLKKIKKPTFLPSEQTTQKDITISYYAKFFIIETQNILKQNLWIFFFIAPVVIIITFLFDNGFDQVYKWV